MFVNHAIRSTGNKIENNRGGPPWLPASMMSGFRAVEIVANFSPRSDFHTTSGYRTNCNGRSSAMALRNSQITGFGSLATSRQRPMALRPGLAAGLPCRTVSNTLD